MGLKGVRYIFKYVLVILCTMAHEVPYAVHTCWTEQPLDYNHDERLYILLLAGLFLIDIA